MKLRWMPLRRVPGALLGLCVATAAQAQSADVVAECFRLSEEVESLSQRNAWAGVEVKYGEIVKLKCDLPYDIHILAARSAATLGKTYEQYQRLTTARELDASEDVLAELSSIDGTYGRVRLRGNERWEVTLRRPSMPFAPDQRKSVEWGITVCREAGGFEGMLPAGTYVLGAEGGETHEFTVEAGGDWLDITIEKSWVSGSEGLVVYHGPVVVAGYAYSGTPAPGEAVVFADTGVHQAQPSTLQGGGLTVDAGYQIGFSREFGVLASVEYRSMYGSDDQTHAVAGWLAGVVTPGRARIAVGPVWGPVFGGGTGVAEWFDVNQSPVRDPADSIEYKGLGFAGGGKLTAGYGLFDLGESLQGVVQVGGSWQTDTARAYWAGHVRLGIAPLVPRFRQ